MVVQFIQFETLIQSLTDLCSNSLISMMLKGVFFLFGVLALAAGDTYLVEDQFGSEYLMVPLPLQRQRRQTTVDVNKNPQGTQVTLGHKGVIFENDKHLVSGEGFVSKQFKPTGPTALGGGVSYEYKPSDSGINLSASNTRGAGTDFSALGNANLWKSRDGNTRVDAYANYDRHYGGPWGTGRPNYGGGIQVSHDF